MIIKQTTVDELKSLPDFFDLLSGYAIESALVDMPFPQPDLAQYANLERAGLLKVISAHEDGKLVGLIALLTTVIPHYNAPVSHVESFYVVPDYRRGSTGMDLLSEAEALSRSLGSVGISVSAAIGSRLEKVMERQNNYRESHRAFFKGFQHV